MHAGIGDLQVELYNAQYLLSTFSYEKRFLVGFPSIKDTPFSPKKWGEITVSFTAQVRISICSKILINFFPETSLISSRADASSC
jgi:hypothetical protein